MRSWPSWSPAAGCRLGWHAAWSDDLTSADAVERVRGELKGSETGQAGLAEVDQLLQLTKDTIPAERIAFTPNLVRGLDYYTGIIFEVVAPGMPGASRPAAGTTTSSPRSVARILPRAVAHSASSASCRCLNKPTGPPYSQIEVAVTVMGEDLAADSFRLAAEIRRAGVRAGVYLGASGKFRKQMKWANDQGARFCVIYGAAERDAGTVTVRDMDSGEQVQVPFDQVAAELARRCAPPS